MELLRRELAQQVLRICRGFAVDSDPPVAVMVVEKVAEALLSDFEAEVRAAGDGRRLGQAFEDAQDARSLSVGARFARARLGFGLA